MMRVRVRVRARVMATVQTRIVTGVATIKDEHAHDTGVAKGHYDSLILTLVPPQKSCGDLETASAFAVPIPVRWSRVSCRKSSLLMIPLTHP